MRRRRFLASAAAAAFAGRGDFGSSAAPRDEEEKKPALVAITLDLEMSRNFPTWDETHWDYEKGNLDRATKNYSVRAARKAAESGGRIHFFAVGRVFEQESVAWLEEIVKAGHPLGNHTYDHVNVKASRPEDIQFRFQRAPWLIEGKRPREVIEENVRMTSAAIKARLGVEPVGFRTPGGFANGLDDSPGVQEMLRGLGFGWVSSKYPAHAVGKPGEEPPGAVYGEILAAQRSAQPYRYPSGLIEVPMSPPSDITVFRGGRWKLEWFLRGVELGLAWAIENGAVFDFLGHPSCLLAVDPELKALGLICDLVRAAGDRAKFADLGELAERAG